MNNQIVGFFFVGIALEHPFHELEGTCRVRLVLPGGFRQQPLALGEPIELCHHGPAMRQRVSAFTQPFEHERKLAVCEGKGGIDPDRFLEQRPRVGPAVVVPGFQAFDIELVGRERVAQGAEAAACATGRGGCLPRATSGP